MGGASVSAAMDKSRCIRVIEGMEVRGNDPMKYFSPTGVGSAF